MNTRREERAQRLHRLITALLVAPLLLVASSSVAGTVAVPITDPGLAPGTQYRLAFVTSGGTTATSSDITTYDAFVQGAADAVPELLALGTTWQVIGSTGAVDAIVHTGTDTGPGSTVPIYLLNGQLLANDGADLWDGSILVPLRADESGGPRGDASVWAGTTASGLRRGDFVLGGPGTSVGLGSTADTDQLWIQHLAGGPLTSEVSLFGISGVLTVPESSTGALLALAFAALLVIRQARSS